jgi:hypothetical protein
MTERRISPEELEVVRWLIANGDTKDAWRFCADSIKGAPVFPCSCGCRSIDFVPQEQSGGSSVVAEATAVWPDGARADVMLWAGEKNGIVGVEILDLEREAIHRRVTADVLRKY